MKGTLLDKKLAQKPFSKKVLFASMLASAALLSACNDSDDDYSPVNPEQPYLSESAYSKDTLDAASSIKVMRYQMNDVNGKIAEATALVMLPKTTMPTDGWRMVVWAHGTVGVGDACAPSNNEINPRFEILANSLLAKGYVVVAPDYEGLGTKGIHPYLNLGSEARSALSAVKAVKAHYKTQVNPQWMSVGQSQGGHASLGIAEYAQLDNDANYKGAVAGAPASSLGYIISTVAPQALANVLQGEAAGVIPKGTAQAAYSELLAYAAYVTTGIRAYEPTLDYKTLFEERSAAIALHAEGTTGDNGLCLDSLLNEFSADISKFLTDNPTKGLLDYPALKAGFDQNPVVAKFLLDNQPATKKINTPVMIIQGTADMAVPYPVTDALQKRLTALGTNVTFVPVEGASHTQAIVQSNTKLVDFIGTQMPAQ